MPFDPHTNGAQTTVAVAPTPPMSGTTIICSSGDGVLFPDPAVVGAYNVSLWPAGTSFRSDIGEIVRVTTHVPTGDSFTVTRHQEGSTARTIAVSWRMAMAPTAKTFTDAEKWNTGTAGGQSVIGGTGASEDLVLSSTTHLTKGKVRIGSSGVLYWDEAAQRLSLNRAFSGSPANNSPVAIHESGTSDPAMEFVVIGTTGWQVGIDNSDADAFKLNNSTGFGDFTDIGIRIDPSGAVLVKGTPGSGADMLQIGQDSPNSYARLRLQGRYHGSSGQGIFDIEALNDQIYIFDRTNGVFLMSWAVGGQVAIAGSLVVSANVGVSGSVTVTGNIVSSARIGVGVVPGYGLDVELGVGATYGKFGASLPVYLIAAQPTLGLNAYYNGGWRYGKGSTAHYGAFVGLAVTTGEVDFSFSPAPGAADVVFSATTPFAVTPTNARLPLLPSQPVLGTDASGNIVAGTGGGASGAFLPVPAGCSAAVMQAAINSLTNGGKIEMPPGVYDWGSTNVTIPAGRSIAIVGAGKGATIIKATGTANALFQFASTAWTQALVKASHVQFVDIQFNADSASNQDLLYFVTDPTYWLQPPAKPLFEALRCYFQYTDHGSNRSSNMCHFYYVTGIRFVDCEWGYDLGTLGAQLQYGLGVWLQPGIQDVNFTDCSWYFMSGVNCGGGGVSCEGIIFQNCRMVGQGLNSVDPLGSEHYGVIAVQVTDFQWRGGEITGLTGFAMHIDSCGPFMIESVYISGNRSTNDIGLIQVENTYTPNDLFFHHIFFKNDGNMQFAILLNNTHGNGFFGSIHDCMFEMTHSGANYVGDPGPTISYVLWHHNFHDATRVGASPGWEGYP